MISQQGYVNEKIIIAKVQCFVSVQEVKIIILLCNQEQLNVYMHDVVYQNK